MFARAKKRQTLVFEFKGATKKIAFPLEQEVTQHDICQELTKHFGIAFPLCHAAEHVPQAEALASMATVRYAVRDEHENHLLIDKSLFGVSDGRELEIIELISRPFPLSAIAWRPTGTIQTPLTEFSCLCEPPEAAAKLGSGPPVPAGSDASSGSEPVGPIYVRCTYCDRGLCTVCSEVRPGDVMAPCSVCRKPCCRSTVCREQLPWCSRCSQTVCVDCQPAEAKAKGLNPGRGLVEACHYCGEDVCLSCRASAYPDLFAVEICEACGYWLCVNCLDEGCPEPPRTCPSPSCGADLDAATRQKLGMRLKLADKIVNEYEHIADVVRTNAQQQQQQQQQTQSLQQQQQPRQSQQQGQTQHQQQAFEQKQAAATVAVGEASLAAPKEGNSPNNLSNYDIPHESGGRDEKRAVVEIVLALDRKLKERQHTPRTHYYALCEQLRPFSWEARKMFQLKAQAALAARQRCSLPECQREPSALSSSAPSAPKLPLCIGCREVRYCHAAHQQADWARHKPECLAWRHIQRSLAAPNPNTNPDGPPTSGSGGPASRPAPVSVAPPPGSYPLPVSSVTAALSSPVSSGSPSSGPRPVASVGPRTSAAPLVGSDVPDKKSAKPPSPVGPGISDSLDVD